jgi:MFS family permease
MDTASIHPPTANRLVLARALRAFGDGYVSLLLPLYLLELGYAPLEVGIIATATLVGSGIVTLGVGLHAHRFHYRALLLAATLVLAFTGLGFASVATFWPMLLIAIVGTLNPSSGDVSLFLPLEHAVLARVVEDKDRTDAFARYALAGSIGAAVGALVVGLPEWLEHTTGLSRLAAMRSMFVLYALGALPMALVYRGLPGSLGATERKAPAPLTQSKARVYTLAALFCVDSFAGGLVVQSMLALWLFQRHDLSPVQAGAIFFWTGLLSALSFLAAVRIAKRIGLVNTMVFTHIPSSLCLIAVPFVDSLPVVLALLFVRAALSQMDVPTRSSYVMAIVLPEERPAAASITAVPRSLASAASPLITGYMLGLSTFGWPLVAAGVLKIAYDLMLLAMFGKIRPPEETKPPRVSP